MMLAHEPCGNSVCATSVTSKRKIVVTIGAPPDEKPRFIWRFALMTAPESSWKQPLIRNVDRFKLRASTSAMSKSSIVRGSK